MELFGLRCKILIIGVVDDWILQRMSPRGWVGGDKKPLGGQSPKVTGGIKKTSYRFTRYEVNEIIS